MQMQDKPTDLQVFLQFIDSVNNKMGDDRLNVEFEDWDHMGMITVTDRISEQSINLNFYEDGKFRVIL